MLALVIGSAQGNWKEVEEVFRTLPVGLVVATNRVVADYRGIIHVAVTLHPKLMVGWKAERDEKLYYPIADYVSFRRTQGGKHFDFVTRVENYLWPEQKSSGSSGLYAVKVALDVFKCTKVVLAGVPMSQDRAHYYSPEPWNTSIFTPAWEDVHDRIKDRVRSMSGWTAGKLGRPTREWATTGE